MNNWDNDLQTKITEGYDVSINRNTENSWPSRGKTTIDCNSYVEILLPISIPATIADQMIGRPFGEYAEKTGILKHYQQTRVKQITSSLTGKMTATRFLLDPIVWDANINLAYYHALQEAKQQAA